MKILKSQQNKPASFSIMGKGFLRNKNILWKYLTQL